jgi:hypothetical protein
MYAKSQDRGRSVLPDVVSTRVMESVIVRFLINADGSCGIILVLSCWKKFGSSPVEKVWILIDPDCENLWDTKVPVFYTSLDLCKSKLKLVLARRGVVKFVRDSETSFIQEANDLLWSFLILEIKLGDPVAMDV